MTIYYVDTSALVKRYLPETGTPWVRKWSRKSAGNVILICDLTTVEMVSFFARREREHALTAVERTFVQNHFLRHVDFEYLVVPLRQPVLATARQMLVKHPLRTLDSLQLAGAIEAIRLMRTKPIFVSADKRLLEAATAEGFPVEDPNTYL